LKQHENLKDFTTNFCRKYYGFNLADAIIQDTPRQILLIYQSPNDEEFYNGGLLLRVVGIFAYCSFDKTIQKF
jgi:hypothetical protein